MRSVKVKICGVTRPSDARLAVDLGADFIGLNFWPGSPRFVTVEQASEIVRTIAGRIPVVGVWVDPDWNVITGVESRIPIDLHQFHGEESPALVEAFGDRAIKAFRLGEHFEGGVLANYPAVWGFLFDCAVAGQYGGTGREWPYERIAQLAVSKPAFVAGGLKASNVARAVRSSGCDLVDVCSGVEAEPGIKDPTRLQEFFREVEHV